MTDLIVGDEGCKFMDVYNALNKPSCAEQLCKKWKEISWELNIPADVIYTIQMGLSHQTMEYSEAYHKIFMSWRGIKSGDAKLGVLMEALENVGLKDAADRLRAKFGVIYPSGRRPQKDFPKFIQAPQGLQNFPKTTSAQESMLMIISTLSLSITLDKIRETIKQPMRFIEESSLQSLASLKANNLMIVVACTSPVSALLEKKTQFPKANLVFVTEQTLESILLQITNIGSKISLKATVDELQWSDLHEVYRGHLLNQLVLVQEDEITLKMALERAGIDTSLEAPLNGMALAEIVRNNNETKTLFSSNLLPELKYYVPRRVISTARLNPEVILKSSADVFIFTGKVIATEIYKLAKKEIVDTSMKQIVNGEITSRFLTLSLKSDFDDICKMTSKPVHCLRYEDGELNWVKSRGDMSSIRKAIERSQDFYDEDEFVDHITSKDIIDRSRLAVCISDTPGMGKSVLLSSIGRKIKHKNPKAVVQFVTLNKFIPILLLHSELKDEVNLRNVIIDVLAKYIGNTELGATIFKEGVKANKLQLNLLLDGYDEIPSSNTILANKCLKEIIKSFPSIRIIVTTRPHFLRDLEDILEVLGHHIMPFGGGDQIQFLTSYWSRKKALDRTKLASFSKTCLSKMRENMTRMDNDIAGIPLQCLLIGKVFKKMAQNCSDPENILSADETPEIGSITELFERVIDLHLKRFSDKFLVQIDDKNKWMRRHAVEALKLLFPRLFEKLSLPGLANTETDISVEDLLRVGILVSNDKNQVPQFIHRLFAEFFVAWFVQHQLQEVENSALSTTLLLDSILITHQVEVEMKGFLFELVDVSARTFTHYMVAYFINNLLPKSTSSESLTRRMAACNHRNQIIEAGAHDNFSHIFHFFRSSLESETLKLTDGNNTDPLFVAVWQSNVTILREYFPIFQNSISKIVQDLRLETYKDNPISLLHVAVCRGDPSVVRFLLNAHNFAQLVTSSSLPLLLHSCVDDSKEDSQEIIQGKIVILQELVEIDQDQKLLKERDIRGRTALLCLNINLHLLKELILLGADVLATDNIGNATVLHKATQYLSRDDYNELTRLIPQEQLKRLVKIPDEKGRTPLHALIVSFDPLDETCQLFYLAGADMNTKNYEDETILTTAVKERRTSDCLKCLVELGATWKIKEENDKSLFHIVLEQGQVEVIKLFMEYGADVNEKDEGDNTPFHVAIRKDHPNHVEIFNLLLEYKLDLHVTNNDKESYLHLAASHKRTDLARVLIEHKLDVNARNWRNNTPLHFALCPPKKSSMTPNAIDNDIFEIAQLLIDNGAEINARNKYDRTPLIQALNFPDHILNVRTLEILKLPENTESDEAATEALRSLLSTTSRNDEYAFHQLADYYLTNGADLEIDEDSKDRSFLHIAALKGTHFAVKFLCEHDLQIAVNSTDSDGNTPLHLAVQNKTGEMLKIVECLIEHGAEVSFTNNQGLNPLNHLISGNPGNIKVETLVVLNGGDCSKDIVTSALKALISKSWDFNSVDRNLETAKALVAARADLTFLDDEGNTLLHIACRNGCVEAVKFLVDSGISTNVTNSQRNTPLHLALLNDNSRLQKAKSSSPNSSTKIPFSFRRKGGGMYETKNRSYYELKCKKRSQIFDEELSATQEEPVVVSTSAQLEIVYFLLERKVPINSLNKNGGNPLVYGLNQDVCAVNIDVLQVLLSRLKTIKSSLATLILCHIIHKLNRFKSNKLCLRFLKFLVQKGANYNYNFVYDDFTVLHYSVLVGNLAAFQYFASLGCDIEVKTRRKDTILHLAPEGLAVEQFHVLLEIVVSKGKGYLLKCCSEAWEDTVLHCAVRNLELPQMSLNLLKKSGADFNAVDKEGESVVHTAIRGKRSVHLIETLIGLGANLNSLNQNGRNLLHLASYFGNLAVVKFLTPLISINSRDKHGNTPLHQTLYECCCLGITRELVGKGADVNAADTYFNTPLHCLFSYNKDEKWEDCKGINAVHKVFRYLLEHGADINGLDGNQIHNCKHNRRVTPLHRAVCTKNIDPVNLLINYGCDLNAQDADGDTPLHYAFELHSANHYEIAKLLIRSGTDVNVVSLEGKSTTDWAIQAYSNATTFKRAEIFRLLVDHGADLSRIMDSGTTTLSHMSAFFTAQHFHEILEHLISKEKTNWLLCLGDINENLLHQTVRNLELNQSSLEVFHQMNFDFNAVDNAGNSVLIYAIYGKRTAQFLSSILKLGADYQLTNHKKENVLHAAAMTGNLEAVQLFLNKPEVNMNFVNAKNDEGNTPVHLLNPESGEPEIQRIILDCFIEAGADVNLRNNDGHKPKIISEQYLNI